MSWRPLGVGGDERPAIERPAVETAPGGRCGAAKAACADWRRRAALTLALLLALTGLVGLAGCAPRTGADTPPGVTSAVSAGWLAYRDPLYGFVIQIPRGAVGVGGSASGATSLGAWRLASPAGGADAAAGAATLEVTATIQPSAALCAHYASGAPTSIGGGGVTGYAQDNLSQPASTSNPPQVSVILLHARLLTIITLTGQGAPSAFMQRWGGDWSHILATFQPGQGPAAAQPCG